MIIKANEHTIMAVLAVIVGLAGGFGAVGFRHLINFFQTVAYGSSGRTASCGVRLAIVPYIVDFGFWRTGRRPAGLFFSQRS